MRHLLRTGRHSRITSSLSFLAVALSALVIAAGPAAAYPQYNTTATVNVRSGPGTGYPIVGTLSAGSTFTLFCQTQNGTSVGGNRTWDEISTSGLNRWISDYYTTTPSFNSYAPGTPDCSRV